MTLLAGHKWHYSVVSVCDLIANSMIGGRVYEGCFLLSGSQIVVSSGRSFRITETMLSLVFLAILLLLYLASRSQPRLPPGPRPLPIIGNLHQAPRKDSWLQFKKWHDQYGPVVSFKVGQQQFVLLGTHKAARDLLDKRSSIYSTRPRSIVAGEYIMGGMGVLFLPYGA